MNKTVSLLSHYRKSLYDDDLALYLLCLLRVKPTVSYDELYRLFGKPVEDLHYKLRELYRAALVKLKDESTYEVSDFGKDVLSQFYLTAFIFSLRVKAETQDDNCAAEASKSLEPAALTNYKYQDVALDTFECGVDVINKKKSPFLKKRLAAFCAAAVFEKSDDMHKHCSAYKTDKSLFFHGINDICDSDKYLMSLESWNAAPTFIVAISLARLASAAKNKLADPYLVYVYDQEKAGFLEKIDMLLSSNELPNGTCAEVKQRFIDHHVLGTSYKSIDLWLSSLEDAVSKATNYSTSSERSGWLALIGSDEI